MSTNANTSRRALQQELGPRARAGKRYLKGQSSASVPFPWAAFADAEVAPGQASILMSQTRSFDRVDPADPSQRAALAGWVPPGMLKAAEAIEALRTDLQAALGDQPPASPSSGPDGSSHRGTRRRSRHRRRQQKQEGEQEVAAATNRRDTLYVGENVAYCGACDVDSLSGPRAGACETDCAAVEARMSISSFDFGQVQFDPVHLVMAAIEAPLPAAAIADAGGGAAVAMDVRDALRLWLRSPVVDLPDAQVAVYAADGQEDGDELVRRWLAEEKEVAKAAHRGAMGASSCSQERLRLTAAFVVHDAEAAALLRWVVQGWDEQQMEEQEQQGGSTAAAGAAAAREALVGAVQGAWPAANGEQEGDCADLDGTPAISFQRSLFVPAYDSPEFLQEQQQQQQPGAASNAQPPINSLRLVDPLRPGVPLGAAGMGAQQNVVLGRSYRMELAGFPPQASVLVALVPVPSSDPGEADAGAAPQAVATLRTDDRGAARALWPVPRRLPPGDYYLQAAAGEGQGEEDDSIWGLSQLYKVATRPARRRKLGPVLEL